MIFGLMALFNTPEELVAASKKVRDSGFTQFDAYTPFPIEDLDEAIGFPRNRVGLLALIGGFIGAVGGFGMQWYACVVDYPINVAGKPDFSWPAFIPVTFELTVLCSALFTVFGMLLLNGLPKPYHPVFAVDEFRRASKDRFFLCIQASDPLFEISKTKSFLRSLIAENNWENNFEPIWEVPLEEE